MKLHKLILKTTALAAAAALMAAALSGCEPASKEKVYAFVAKDVSNPYMEKMFDGFKEACIEEGASALYRGPESTAPEKQIDVIKQLIDLDVSGIAVAANDRDKLQPVLKDAMKAGIPVISLDSAVNSQSRSLHIQQTDPETIGRDLIRSAAKIVNGKGGIAILSTTPQATNQDLWIQWMKKELEEYPEKYAETPLIKIAYGDDESKQSDAETRALLNNEKVKVIIAPTTVGMLAAAKVLKETGSDVKLTGLGFPSQMQPYIEEGICPEMYLWNTADIGYLAGYALEALAEKTITGKEGDTFDAGKLGQKSVTLSADNGTEVVLGDPLLFNAENIAVMKDSVE